MFYVSILTKGHGVMVTYIWYVMVQLSDYCICLFHPKCYCSYQLLQIGLFSHQTSKVA